MKKIYYAMIPGISFALSLGCFASCSSDDSPGEKTVFQNEPVPIILDEASSEAARDLKNFYVDFTRDAVTYVDNSKLSTTKNVIVSPVSASMVLAMVANGVEEDLAKEITNYLGHENIGSLNSFSRTLLEELPKADNQAQLKFANAIWVNQNYKLSAGYTSTVETYYNSNIFYVDINNNAGKVLKAINGWCADNTEGLIPSIIDDIDPTTIGILLNALYFKGKWEEGTFKEENTGKATFEGANKASEVSMMHARSITTRYNMNDHFQLVSLRFGNSSFSLILVLPEKGLSLQQANELLTPEEFYNLFRDSKTCFVDVYLPKFKIDSKLDLNEILRMTPIAGLVNKANTLTMYDPAATASNIFKQATSFEVDEKGAVVAAITSDEQVSAAGPIENGHYELRLDRPFYFFLTNADTGAFLLSGRITDL